MKRQTMKIRNFRLDADLDERLISASEKAAMDPSKLLRILVIYGTTLMLCDSDMQLELYKQFAL
jgi:hypothetical protein